MPTAMLQENESCSVCVTLCKPMDIAAYAIGSFVSADFPESAQSLQGASV